MNATVRLLATYLLPVLLCALAESVIMSEAAAVMLPADTSELPSSAAAALEAATRQLQRYNPLTGVLIDGHTPLLPAATLNGVPISTWILSSYLLTMSNVTPDADVSMLEMLRNSVCEGTSTPEELVLMGGSVNISLSLQLIGAGPPRPLPAAPHAAPASDANATAVAAGGSSTLQPAAGGGGSSSAPGTPAGAGGGGTSHTVSMDEWASDAADAAEKAMQLLLGTRSSIEPARIEVDVGVPDAWAGAESAGTAQGQQGGFTDADASASAGATPSGASRRQRRRLLQWPLPPAAGGGGLGAGVAQDAAPSAATARAAGGTPGLRRLQQQQRISYGAPSSPGHAAPPQPRASAHSASASDPFVVYHNVSFISLTPVEAEMVISSLFAGCSGVLEAGRDVTNTTCGRAMMTSFKVQGLPLNRTTYRLVVDVPPVVSAAITVAVAVTRHQALNGTETLLSNWFNSSSALQLADRMDGLQLAPLGTVRVLRLPPISIFNDPAAEGGAAAAAVGSVLQPEPPPPPEPVYSSIVIGISAAAGLCVVSVVAMAGCVLWRRKCSNALLPEGQMESVSSISGRRRRRRGPQYRGKYLPTYDASSASLASAGSSGPPAAPAPAPSTRLEPCDSATSQELAEAEAAGADEEEGGTGGGGRSGTSGGGGGEAPAARLAAAARNKAASRGEGDARRSGRGRPGLACGCGSPGGSTSSGSCMRSGGGDGASTSRAAESLAGSGSSLTLPGTRSWGSSDIDMELASLRGSGRSRSLVRHSGAACSRLQPGAGGQAQDAGWRTAESSDDIEAAVRLVCSSEPIDGMPCLRRPTAAAAVAALGAQQCGLAGGAAPVAGGAVRDATDAPGAAAAAAAGVGPCALAVEAGVWAAGAARQPDAMRGEPAAPAACPAVSHARLGVGKLSSAASPFATAYNLASLGDSVPTIRLGAQP